MGRTVIVFGLLACLALAVTAYSPVLTAKGLPAQNVLAAKPFSTVVFSKVPPVKPVVPAIPPKLALPPRDEIPYHCTDVYASGMTDLPDFAFLGQHYNSCINDGSGRYDARADFDSSGCIDTVDFAIFSQFYSQSNAGNVYCTLVSGPYNCPDMNADGAVDLVDQASFSAAFGTELGQPGFNPAADFNGDGHVNGIDLAIFTKAFNEPEWTYYCQ